MTRKSTTPTQARMNRRTALQLLGGTAVAATAPGLGGALAAGADAETIIRAHGYSFFGDLKYPPDFKHAFRNQPRIQSGFALPVEPVHPVERSAR